MKINKPSLLYTDIQGRLTAESFDKWFETHVEPVNRMLEGAVEVYSFSSEFVVGITRRKTHIDTHRALLINIEPIKKETAETVLNEVLDTVDKYDLGESLHCKIKAVLGEK